MSDKTQNKADVKHVVRVFNTDLEGSKPILHALTKIKGVSFMMANAICVYTNMDKKKITGTLSPDDVNKFNDILKNPIKMGIPNWMVNRKKDPETGEDMHLVASDLRFTQDNDLKILKRIKSYIGIRHMSRLPVRGQRTKSNFRRSKGKNLGVQRKGKGKK